jgi:hypothetical protein
MNVFSFFKYLYRLLPIRLRPFIKPLEIFYREMMMVWLPLYLWNGQSKQNGYPLCVAYIGTIPKHQHYYINLMFDPQPEITYHGRFFYKKIIRLLKKPNISCAMALWEHNPYTVCYLQKVSQFIIPNWVKMKIDISSPLQEMEKQKHSGFRSIKRHIRKYQYTYIRTANPDDFADFYEHMYLPFAKQRFGETASISSYTDVFKSTTQTELFIVKNPTGPVAGMVVEYQKDDAILTFFGIKDGNINLIRQGLLGVNYYYIIEALQKKGYQRVNVGDSRPFINDGVIRYKTRLLATLEKSYQYKPHHCTSLLFIRNVPGSRDFLLHNPFLHLIKKSELTGSIWISQTQDMTQDEFTEVCKYFKHAGIRHCNVYSFQSPEFFSYISHGDQEMSFSIHHANKKYSNR